MTFFLFADIIGLVTQTEKKTVITNLLVVPSSQKRLFWGREIKNLNILYELYPNDFFWKNLSFSHQLESLTLLRSGFYSDELSKKYKRFIYKIPKKQNLPLGEVCGESLHYKIKPKTIKKFLS